MGRVWQRGQGQARGAGSCGVSSQGSVDGCLRSKISARSQVVSPRLGSLPAPPRSILGPDKPRTVPHIPFPSPPPCLCEQNNIVSNFHIYTRDRGFHQKTRLGSIWTTDTLRPHTCRYSYHLLCNSHSPTQIRAAIRQFFRQCRLGLNPAPPCSSALPHKEHIKVQRLLEVPMLQTRTSVEDCQLGARCTEGPEPHERPLSANSMSPARSRYTRRRRSSASSVRPVVSCVGDAAASGQGGNSAAPLAPCGRVRINDGGSCRCETHLSTVDLRDTC